MGVPAAKAEPQPRVRARARVRAKAQLTLPGDIRRALHIGEGTRSSSRCMTTGRSRSAALVSIPTDQAWFFTPEWLTGEQEADNEIAAGRGTVHESADAMSAHLDGLGAADE